jgi:mutator family transposase
VHWYRNIFSHVPTTKVREIAAMLKAIDASEDVVAAREKAIRVIEKLHGFRLTKAAELAQAGVAETLTYYSFPEEHWRRIRTNNPLERLPARDQASYARGRGIPRRPIGLEPRRGQAAPRCWHGVVEQEISQHRAAEGPADERSHHRLSQ